jgi:kynurenine 3-monooxygenase
MRDLVADEEFLLRKKIESKIHEQFPSRWIPLYSMVTFYDNIPYAVAYQTGKKQKAIMDEVMKTPEIATRWQSLNLEDIVNKL